MSFILPDEISDAEMLYRSVPDKPNMWKPEFNRPSSALFKDSKGVSVDRDGGRSIEEIIANFDRKMPERGLVSITAGECRKIGTKPVAKPL